MALIKWFLWRRRLFIRHLKPFKGEPIYGNFLKVNFASCRTYPFIYRDMERILRRNREANLSASQRSNQK